jgi:hypothetical protein
MGAAIESCADTGETVYAEPSPGQDHLESTAASERGAVCRSAFIPGHRPRIRCADPLTSTAVAFLTCCRCHCCGSWRGRSKSSVRSGRGRLQHSMYIEALPHPVAHRRRPRWYQCCPRKVSCRYERSYGEEIVLIGWATACTRTIGDGTCMIL